MADVDFWFEFASTYSYPAASRIEARALASGVRVHFRPFLLGPIFAEQGWNDSPFNIYPAKGMYMWRDLERICTALGVPLKKPSVFPQNGLLGARVATALEEERRPELVRRIYRANFVEDRDISDREVMVSLLTELGHDAEALLLQAESAENKAKLRSATEQAVRLGIFGAPSFVVGSELFWGNDRLEEALDWAVRITPPRSA